MEYTETKHHNGTRYIVRAEQIAVGLIRAQVFYKDIDSYPVKEIEYQHRNLVTCAGAVWAEYKNEIRQAINTHQFKKSNHGV